MYSFVFLVLVFLRQSKNSKFVPKKKMDAKNSALQGLISVKDGPLQKSGS